MRLEVENASKLIFCQDGSPSKFHYLLELNSECLGPCALLVLLLEAVKSPVGELPSTLVEKVMEQGMGERRLVLTQLFLNHQNPHDSTDSFSWCILPTRHKASALGKIKMLETEPELLGVYGQIEEQLQEEGTCSGRWSHVPHVQWWRDLQAGVEGQVRGEVSQVQRTEAAKEMKRNDSGSDSARICHHRGAVHGQLGKIARTQTRKQMTLVLPREQSEGLWEVRQWWSDQGKTSEGLFTWWFVDWSWGRFQFSSVQSLSCVCLFAKPWTTACQASLSITNTRNFHKLMSIESMMPSNHLILCCLLLPSSIFPNIRVFSNESVPRIRWPKYWSFSFRINPSNKYSGLISFRIDWVDFLAVQGTLKSLLQHHSSKASILQCSSFFMDQLSHPYMTTGKNIALTRRTFVNKVMSLLFNKLSRLLIAFIPRSKCLLISWLQSPSAVILETKKIKSITVSIVSPSTCHEEMGQDAMILALECWVLSQFFHSPVSLSSRVSFVPLHFLPLGLCHLQIWAIFIPACAWFRLCLISHCVSSSPGFCMMYSAYKLNKQGDDLQPWHTPFQIWNQSLVACLVLTVASWPAYRFLRRQVRWSGISIT